MDALESYSYSPLPTPTSIRLFTLLPPQGPEAALTGRIDVHDIESCPDFEAISYVWGDVQERRPITIQAKDRTQYSMLIPINLHQALSRFSQWQTHRVLWTDYICIDQTGNQDEKAQQVMIMGRIYGEASTVLVWLGHWKDQALADSAIECINALLKLDEEFLAQQCRIWKAIQGSNADSDSEIKCMTPDQIHDTLTIPRLDSPEFSALRLLIGSNYFHRAWTWQESFLAKRKVYHLNNWRFEEEDIRKVNFCLMALCGITNSLEYFPDNGVAAFAEHVVPMCCGRSVWDQSSDSELFSFVTQLRLRRGSQCTLASDEIYSLLGAVVDAPPIKVDYNLPFESVFADCTWQIIKQQGNFDVLSMTDRSNRSPNLPSWVPDWRLKGHHTTGVGTTGIDSREGRLYGPYAAATYYKAQAEVSPDMKVLKIHALVLDDISQCREWGEDMITWCRESLAEVSATHANSYLFTNEPMPQAYLRTWFQDRTIFDYENVHNRCGSEAWDELLMIAMNLKEVNPTGNRDKQYKEMLSLSVEHRKLFVTRNGILGIADDSVRVGDVLVLAFGNALPLLLRPATQYGPEHFTFVAECYAHGFMDGEGLNGQSAKILAQMKSGKDPAQFDSTEIEDIAKRSATIFIH